MCLWMLGGYLQGVGRLFGGCEETVWVGSLEGMEMLSARFEDAVWRIWGGCL